MAARTVLITGANRGIGLEFARQYLSRGERVLATCRDPKKADELTKLAKSHRDRLLIVPLDVASEESIKSARQAVTPHAEAIDTLINNAGVYGTHLGPDGQPAEKIGALNAADALTVLRTNAVAPLLIAQGFMDLLQKADEPRIVNITSGYGSISSNAGDFPYYYSASKAALNMFMRSLAGDSAARGVITIVMSPGWVKTDMGTSAAPLAAKDSVAGMIKVIDNLTPDDNSRFLNYKGEEQPWQIALPTVFGFIHRFVRGSDPSAPTILLLHGTGGDETDLLGIGESVAPGASLLSPRGKSLDEGYPRFFRRFGEGKFDEADIIFRTGELADFVATAAEHYKFDSSRVIALGFSNGANIAAALMLLKPQMLAGAMLLRAMVPLTPKRSPDLSGKSVLMCSAKLDPIVPTENAQRLATMLQDAGADVTLKWFNTGHGLTQDDLKACAAWYGRMTP